jgi:aminoglycoside 3-N-acetyltransferase
VSTLLKKEVLMEALHAIGILEGDLLFIHSDLRVSGIPPQARTREEILKFYYDTLAEVVGKTGTLAVPAYYYEYARYGDAFDVDTSPVSMPLGVFCSYFNSLPGRRRSLNPLTSVAAIGAKADALCGGDSMAGYGVASPWHRLRELGGKLLFLGTSLQPMTFVHHIEQQYGVPHLYTKIYPYPVLRNGAPVPGNPISVVRYLDYKIEYDLSFFQKELEKRRPLKTHALGGGSVHLVTAEDAFQTGVELLKRNPYSFLKQPPEFVAGKIPTDGITGPLKESL